MLCRVGAVLISINRQTENVKKIELQSTRLTDSCRKLENRGCAVEIVDDGLVDGRSTKNHCHTYTVGKKSGISHPYHFDNE